MTRARNIAGFSTITTTPSPIHVGPIGVLTATRINGEFGVVDIQARTIEAVSIAATNFQVSGITTGLNVSGIITAQNGINFNGTSTGLNVSGVSTIATLSVTGNANIAGVLTYEDVTNVDSVGVITARSGIQLDDSITHIGDTNTKIRFPANDTFSVETAGYERFRITSSGKVLIGRDSARQTRLGSNSFNSIFQLEAQDGAAALQVTRFSDSASPARLVLQAGRGTSASPGIAHTSDHSGQIVFSSYDGSNFTNTAQIRSEVDGTPGTDDMPGNIIFGTTPDGSNNLLERLRIDSSGRLLTGNISETVVGANGMHIRQSSAGNNLVSLILENHGTTANTSTELKFVPTDASPDDRFNSIKVLDTTGNNQFDTTFLTCEGSTPVERLRITSAGLIGIGTDDPSAVLHVDKNGTNQVLARFESNMGTNNNRALSIISPTSDSSSLPFTFVTGNSIQFKCDTHVVTIDDNAKVGIGTDNPDRPLHIENSDCRIRLTEVGEPIDVELQNNGGNAILTTNGASQLRLQTNNTPRLVIQSGGSVGIGTADAGNDKVKIQLSDSNNANFRVVGGSGQGRTNIVLQAGNNTAGAFCAYRLVNSSGTGIGAFQMENNTDDISIFNSSQGGNIFFHTNESGSSLVKMEIQDDGHVKINNGDLIIGTGGHGISFSADSNASGSTSELLNDYEEGEFTPSATDGNNTFSQGQESGKYIKVGNIVQCTFTFNCSISGTSGFAFFIQGLPFTVKNYGSHANEGLGHCKGTGQAIQLEAQQDQTRCKARSPSSGSAMTVNDVGCVNNVTKNIRGTITYHTT